MDRRGTSQRPLRDPGILAASCEALLINLVQSGMRSGKAALWMRNVLNSIAAVTSASRTIDGSFDFSLVDGQRAVGEGSEVREREWAVVDVRMMLIGRHLPMVESFHCG